MHDALFELQSQFGPDLIPELADRLDLHLEALREDMIERRFQARIERVARGGTRIGVVETPTFFVNGERHAGDSDELSLVTAIMRFVA